MLSEVERGRKDELGEEKMIKFGGGEEWKMERGGGNATDCSLR